MSAREGTKLWRRPGAVVAVLVCGAVVVQAAGVRPARACTEIVPAPTLNGLPADGATGVPTDVRPFFDAQAAYVYGTDVSQEPTFQLTSDTGAVVALAFQPTYPQAFELVPAAELAPLTTYALTGQWPAPTDATPPTPELTLTFTTGAGPVAAPPVPPAAAMEHYSLPGSQQSACQPDPNGTCVSFPAGTAVEATYFDPSSQFMSLELHAQPFFTDLTGINQGTPFTCVSLRTRAPNGSKSEPQVLCGADAPTLNLRGTGTLTCSSVGITFPSTLALVQSSGGCAVGGGAGGSAGRSLLGALVGLALLIRRAGKPRRPPRAP